MGQLTLFGEPTKSLLITERHINHFVADKIIYDIESIAGLKYIPNFLTHEQQNNAVIHIDAADNEWRNDLSRRVQHYGWRYDYKARAITPDMYLGVLPDWLDVIARQLYATGYFSELPNQVIVNEYLPGQGIATHIDHPGFGPTVCMISLLDNWEMDFSENWKDKSPALLEIGSCIMLTGESRFVWQHGIAPRKSEVGHGGRRSRSRRLSLTFRTVVNKDGVNVC